MWDKSFLNSYYSKVTWSIILEIEYLLKNNCNISKKCHHLIWYANKFIRGLDSKPLDRISKSCVYKSFLRQHIPAIIEKVICTNVSFSEIPQIQTTCKNSISSRFHSAKVSFSRDDSAALDLRRKSAVSRLCGNGNYGPERGSDGTLILR